TGDETVLHERIIPFADASVRFFESISPRRDENGRMIMDQANALETWWETTNNAPDVAGLHHVLNRLIALPEKMTTEDQRKYWMNLRQILPEIPVGEVAVKNGKIVEDPQADPDVTMVRMLLPAEKYSHKGNIETPELCSVFPYPLYGLGHSTPEELELARTTFRYRRDPLYRGWGYDEILAAHLGLTEDAANGLAKRFDTWADGFRFPAFWGPNFDWIPDQDHGCSGMIALQSMLMQTTEDGKILLLPAWPQTWNVEFRLHAPYGTVVEGRWTDGEIRELKVTPESRKKDLVLP
ncbi:MAG: hypothetical protein Q4C47_09580, partial [Planctomycetia bacterium]|nr:hypothetical protein [Planctomycetia bacterium]